MYCPASDDERTRLLIDMRDVDNFIRIDEEPPCPVQRGVWLRLSRRAKLVYESSVVAYYKNTACVRLLMPPDNYIMAAYRRLRRHRNWALWFG